MDIYDIQYDSKSETVHLVDPTGKIKVFANESPTVPIKSQDKTKAVYISPFEWEVYGNLYLVDLQNGEQEILVATEGSNIPKNVIWEDNENVLVVIGLGDGTVCIGGNIYRVNVKTKEKTQITSYDPKVQITDLYIKDGTLHYKGIKYINEDMNESVVYENYIA